ncbi:transposase [Escherichia coli]|uniref:transposase n=6 Tax=Escherichia coli TaxID=562 RepID=UPI001F155C63|nr:transposase [Escherichia coli]
MTRQKNYALTFQMYVLILKLNGRYYYKGVLWSPGYFASSCGGAPISVIRQYIEQQQTPGQVENRALYPRPEGRGFTAHRIKKPSKSLSKTG